MEDDLELRKKILKEKLENELYVDRYQTFKESVSLINEALKTFNINYQYNYDQFCSDFTDECLKYQSNHPESDITDPKQVTLYTLQIIMSIIDNAKNKYGVKND